MLYIKVSDGDLLKFVVLQQLIIATNLRWIFCVVYHIPLYFVIPCRQ